MKKMFLLVILTLALICAALPALAADTAVAPGDSLIVLDKALFIDQDKIDNQLAVAVLVKLGIIDGYAQADGSFRFDPDRVVTRAEMAKIISVIKTGGQDVAAYQNIIAADFQDVPETYWARPYVEYCASFGIIAGRGDGRFYPEDPVKNPEAIKMLLAALGYDPTANGLVGTEWQFNTIDLALTSGVIALGGEADTSNAGCGRDNMALLVYQALFAKTAGGSQAWLAVSFGKEKLDEINAYIGRLLTQSEPEKVVYLKDLPLRTEFTAFIHGDTAYKVKDGYSCDAYDADGNLLLSFVFEEKPVGNQVAVYKILGSGKISFIKEEAAKDYLPCPDYYEVVEDSPWPEEYVVKEHGAIANKILSVKATVPVYDLSGGEIEEIGELEEGDQFYLMQTEGGKLLAIFITAHNIE